MAWTLATGAAVTLSWWGVHTVMSGTAYDRPRALPITGTSQKVTEEATPRSSSTQRPRETPKPDRPDGSGKDTDQRGAAGDGTRSGTPSGSAPGGGSTSDGGTDGGEAGAKPTGNVKSYIVSGGRVAFEIGGSSAELVSATPDAGWQMQVWKQPKWIRVTFTQAGREVSVFCTWHDHEPRVEIDDR